MNKRISFFLLHTTPLPPCRLTEDEKKFSSFSSCSSAYSWRQELPNILMDTSIFFSKIIEKNFSFSQKKNSRQCAKNHKKSFFSFFLVHVMLCNNKPELMFKIKHFFLPFLLFFMRMKKKSIQFLSLLLYENNITQ